MFGFPWHGMDDHTMAPWHWKAVLQIFGTDLGAHGLLAWRDVPRRSECHGVTHVAALNMFNIYIIIWYKYYIYNYVYIYINIIVIDIHTSDSNIGKKV